MPGMFAFSPLPTAAPRYEETSLTPRPRAEPRLNSRDCATKMQTKSSMKKNKKTIQSRRVESEGID